MVVAGNVDSVVGRGNATLGRRKSFNGFEALFENARVLVVQAPLRQWKTMTELTPLAARVVILRHRMATCCCIVVVIFTL